MNGENIKEGISWGKVYEDSYKKTMTERKWRCVSLPTFYKLRASHMINYALKRKQEGKKISNIL
jgi:hypothetical protein